MPSVESTRWPRSPVSLPLSLRVLPLRVLSLRMPPLRVLPLLMTLALDIACGTPPPPPAPPPLPPPPPLVTQPKSRYATPQLSVRNGSRIAIDNVFAIDVPETAIVRRGFGDEGQPTGVFIDKTFQIDFVFDVPLPARLGVAPRQVLQIDGREASVVRYRETVRGPSRGRFWLTADFPDIYNERKPEPDDNLRLVFRANCLDLAAQDLMERMVRSIRFMSQTRP
jgi:hypothetical protein